MVLLSSVIAALLKVGKGYGSMYDRDMVLCRLWIWSYGQGLSPSLHSALLADFFLLFSPGAGDCAGWPGSHPALHHRNLPIYSSIICLSIYISIYLSRLSRTSRHPVLRHLSIYLSIYLCIYLGCHGPRPCGAGDCAWGPGLYPALHHISIYLSIYVSI